jgi:hypothetical protein
MSDRSSRRWVFSKSNPRWRPLAKAKVFVMDTSLPSSVDGIDFNAVFRAAWTSNDPEISRQHGYALTMEHLWKKSETITKNWYVMHHDAAQAAVNAAIDPIMKLTLATNEPETTMITVTGNVTLTASDHAIRATREYLTLRRDEETRRQRTSAHLYELRRALKSPGIAELWWASNNPQHLSMIDTDPFKKLVTAITDATDDDIQAKTAIEQILLKFTAEFSSAEDRQLLLNIFKRLLDKFDRHDLLRELD